MFGLLKKHKKQRIHFLHAGKTGGTALKSVLRDFRKTPQYRLVLHRHKTSLQDIPQGDGVIFFLRDPVARFISAFYSRQRKGRPRYRSDWSPLEKAVFEKFSTPNNLAVSLADESSDHHALAVRAMKHIYHFTPYRAWFGDLDYFRSRVGDLLFIGFQESLDGDFDTLKSILGIPQEVLLPTDDIAAHKSPAGLDKSIEERGIAALEYWYAEDYKFLSFCKQLRF